MKFQEVIDKRHTTREFEEKKVSLKTLKKLVSNATKAPSAANWQPGEFYIIQSEEMIKKLSEILVKFLGKENKELKKLPKKLQGITNKFYSTLGGCKTVIFVYTKRNKDLRKRDSSIMSVSASIENLLLSAVDENLGTCWMGSFKMVQKEINVLLKIPKNFEMVAGLLIGYPKKGYIPLKRKKKKLSEVLRVI
ncbi:nitroreductase family protein [Candidatus Pacearchaeota archaeon]|nr:nitroreductase family protein [Candidatus Pacearchaeota archaeon]